MTTRDEREVYMGRLRRVYDSLKGKWRGQKEVKVNVRRLYDSIQRDAIRTDPTEAFFVKTRRRWIRRRGMAGRSLSVGESEAEGMGEDGEEDNIRKLVDIMLVYTLEHEGISYTQGMTDLLSPILYVMGNEDDAYIVYCAMMERIKNNFGTWCLGTLHKIERLKHICEVLDPQLYSYLVNTIEEDAFTLFFGMVLIECRREFSFQDSLHLLEVVWAAAQCEEGGENGLGGGNGIGVSAMDASGRVSLNAGEGGEGLGVSERSASGGMGLDAGRGEGLGTPGFPGVGVDSGLGVGLSASGRDGLATSGLGQADSAIDSSWAKFMTYESPEIVRQVFGLAKSPYAAILLRRSSEMSSLDEEDFGAASGRSGSPYSDVFTPTHERASPGGTVTMDEETLVVEVEIEEEREEEGTPHYDTGVRSASCPRVQEAATTAVHGDDARGSTARERSLSDSSLPSPTVRGARPTTEELLDSARPGVGAEPRSGVVVHLSNEMSDMSSVSSNGVAASLNDVAMPSKTIRGQNGTLAKRASDPMLVRHRVKELDEDPFAVSPIVNGKGSSGSSSYVTANDSREVSINAHIAAPPLLIYPRGASPEPPSDNSIDFAGPVRMPTDLRGQIEAMNPSHSFDAEAANLNSRLSPLAPFFDTMQQMASAVDRNVGSPRSSDGAVHAHSRTNSDVSLIISQLMSIERSAPQVSPASSLGIPFAQSFSLFVCLAILFQHRAEVVRGELDFVGLSVLMNNNAGRQNLDRTLCYARFLHGQYRNYQRMCFGEGPGNAQWLDSAAGEREGGGAGGVATSTPA